MNELGRLTEKLKTLRSAVICTHISPDADAIGSAGGLWHVLNLLGMQAVVYFPDALPERFRRLWQDIPFTHEVPTSKIEAVISVDCATKSRLGPAYSELLESGEEVINIDHHGSNECWGDIAWVVPDASATALMIERLGRELEVTLTPAAANLLYAGLMDDTGSFRYGNTTVEAFDCAARLLKAGASAEDVANLLYYSIPERVLRVKARALGELQVVLNGKLSVITVTNEMLKECGARPEDTEGVVELARSLEGVEAAAFIRELEQGWKVSLRAKSAAVDVNNIAGRFGGGGHAAAAGCRLDGSREEVEAAIIECFKGAW